MRRGAGGWAELIYVTTGCQFITSMNLEIRRQHRCLTRVEFTLRFVTMIQDWISAFSPDRSVLCFRSSTLLVRYTNRPFRHQGKHTKRLTVQLCVVDHCLHNDRRSASSRRLGIIRVVHGPISCDPTQPNPWVNPAHGQLWNISSSKRTYGPPGIGMYCVGLCAIRSRQVFVTLDSNLAKCWPISRERNLSS